MAGIAGNRSPLTAVTRGEQAFDRRGTTMAAADAGRGVMGVTRGRKRTRQVWRDVISFAGVLACLAGSARAAGEYPLVLNLDAKADTGAASVTSSVAIRVDRVMEESRRKRVTDTLTTSGYSNFLTALRTLPPIGTIAVQKRMVDIRYAREQQEGTVRRIILVADRPLFFLSADPSRNKAGYELTVVDLRIDAQGGVTGTMSGAARVKPSPDGPVIGDFAEAPVRLSSRAGRP
jgi:hypothetical protein